MILDHIYQSFNLVIKKIRFEKSLYAHVHGVKSNISAILIYMNIYIYVYACQHLYMSMTELLA